jgi:hypothetical protein
MPVAAGAIEEDAPGAGRPSEKSDSNRDVPVPRVTFYVAFGTNTSSAKRLVFASAAVYMPLVPA